MTKWTDFVKAFAKKHNLSYGCALSDVRCREEYHYYKTADLKPTEKKKSKKVILSEQKPKKVKPILEIPEQWLEYMKVHNIPDFLENKKELKKRYKEELREIVEHFGLKVSKNDDKEKLANIIVNFVKNYNENLEQNLTSSKPIIDIQNFPPELQVIFNRFLQNSHNSNKSLEDFLKSKKFLTNLLKANLRIIANTFGIKVSKYDDREKLADKILKYTTNLE